MSNLNHNEIGQIIRVNANLDISLSTPMLILLPEVGEVKEITQGVTIPSVDVTVGSETYLADQYIEYSTIDGDLDYTGGWKKKAKLDFSASNVMQTDYQKFRVLA